MDHALAIDAGTTALKCAVVDCAGRMAAVHVEEYALLRRPPDIVELPVETYWQAAVRAVRGAVASAGIAPSQVCALGVTSQGETLVVLDAAGRPLRHAIVWLDQRSGQEADEIGRAFGLDRVYRVTGQQEMVPTWTATRIAWLRRHEPEVYRNASRFLLVEDYLLYRLTGEYVTDAALNPSTLYLDLASGRWWAEMLDYLGIGEGRLPRILTSCEVAGRVTPEAATDTGLPAGAPVTTAPLDQIAAAVGAGNLEAGVVTETTGAALALCATLDQPTYDPQRRVGLYCHALPGRFALLPWAPTAGMALRWFRDEFGAGRDYAALAAEAAAVPAGADGLLMLPHLCGAGSPAMNPAARGVFCGVTLSHTRGHFVRAILEAVAFMLRENLDMLESLGAPVREVRCLGGAARSDLWLQIKADVCGRDLLVMECEEAACLGTAMVAFTGVGVHRSLAEAAECMVRPRRRVSPQAGGRYDRAFRRYQELYRLVTPFFGGAAS